MYKRHVFCELQRPMNWTEATSNERWKVKVAPPFVSTAGRCGGRVIVGLDLLGWEPLGWSAVFRGKICKGIAADPRPAGLAWLTAGSPRLAASATPP